MKGMNITAALLVGALSAPALAEDPANPAAPAEVETQAPAEAEIQQQIEQLLVELQASRAMTPGEAERFGINVLINQLEADLNGQEQVEVKRPEYVRAPFLGVNAKPLDIETAKELGLKRSMGLLVTNLPGNGPAGKAGLKKGDVLTKFNDQLLINAEQFAVLVRSQAIGDKVTLHGLRDGEPIELEVTLGEADVLLLGAGGKDLDREWRLEFSPLQGLRGNPLEPGVEVAPGLWIGDGWGDHADGMPAEVRDMFEQMQEQMARHRADMEKQMEELRLQLDLDLDQLRERGMQQGGQSSAQASMVQFDGEHRISLNSRDGETHLKIENKDGKVIFDGPMPGDGKVPGLDKHIQDKVDKMLANTRVDIRKAPVPLELPVPPDFEQQRIDVDQLMRQIREKLDQQRDDPQGRSDAQGGQASASGSATTFDGEHEIKLVSKDGARHLTIKDKNGKVIFDGPMPKDGKVPGLDKNIQDKVDKLHADTRIEVR